MVKSENLGMKIRKYIKKLGLKRFFLILFTLSIFLGLMVSFPVLYKLSHFEYKEQTYKLSNFDDGTWTFKDHSNDTIIFTYSKFRKSLMSRLNVNTQISDKTLYAVENIIMNDISIDTGTSVFQYTYDNLNLYKLVNLDQQVRSRKIGVESFYKQSKDEKVEEWKLLLDTLKLIKYDQTFLLPLFILVNIITSMLGCHFFVFPEMHWKIRMTYITDGGKPTQFFKIYSRIFGLILVSIGIFFPLIYLTF